MTLSTGRIRFGTLVVMARTLTESTPFESGPTKIAVDPLGGVITGVKVLGRHSRNRYGIAGSTGTEYSVEGMRKALPLYEGVKVMTDHPHPQQLGGSRTVRDLFGVLKNLRVEGTGDAEGIYGDLHYLTSHPLAPAVAEDVQRDLKLYGLSHNATGGTERYDRARKRLVIESIAHVRTVDLVDRPATNRSLAESEESPVITFRSLLESQRTRFAKLKGKRAWMDRLLEMDDTMAPMDAPVDPAGTTDPDEALKAGFKSAVLAVVEQAIAGEMDTADALKKIKELLTTHDKLSGDGDAEAPAADNSDSDYEADDKDKTESEKEPAELVALRAEKKVRQLCESLQFTPTELQLESLVGLGTDAKRKALIASFKSQATAGAGKGTSPRSRSATTGAGASTGTGTGRTLGESEELAPADALALLRRR